MEAILVPSSPDQSISPYKQIKNPKRNTRSFVSRRTENLAPTNIHGGLLFFPPPSLSYSYPPPFPLHSHQQQQQKQRQPPLLPLPITRPYNSLPPRSRDLSCPPASRKPNRTRDQSLTPKKSKKPTKTKEEESKPKETIATQVMTSAESLIVTSTNPLGPDPNDLPKDIIKVLSSSSSSSSIAGNNSISKDMEKFSGSMFTISPPPSSLPLPKFSIRPKLSCNAEAAGIDAGATDNLRRLLRLR